ncbi:MAG: glycosyltransferase family 2 protein [Candidatus Rokubacteria bacterium]|nr:glycosyltransferase family 2 protein [Candidatus Rokubacteria bacterium]
MLQAVRDSPGTLTPDPPRSAPASVIMLVHNEAGIIEDVVREYHREIIAKLPGSELLVLEDGSRDGTTEILRRLETELGITLVHHDERRGYTAALRDGLSRAAHDVVFWTDGDGQHDARDFWRLRNRLAHADMVVGYKRPRRDPVYRRVVSRVFNTFVGLYFGLWLHDVNCGFRLMTRPVVEDLLADAWQLRACIASELSIRAHFKGYAVVEVPIRHRPRRDGASRGLPLRSMPGAILHIVRELAAMKTRIAGGTF